jgi:phosphoribosylamine--glycine ligase/phosphoribosylformylglycinamidine cyclo-ligase
MVSKPSIPSDYHRERSVFPAGDYDLAGFAVGAVERTQILPRRDISIGDILLGIPSSGLHSNGFSLVRKILQNLSLSYSSPAPWSPTQTLGETLLTPTKIYIESLLPVVRQGGIKAMAHITGGGFVENVPRMLPTGLGAMIDAGAWALPGVFTWLMQTGRVEALEMCKTFNCGMGMVLVVAEEDVEGVVRGLRDRGEIAVKVGEIKQGQGVEMRGLESWRV